MHQEPTFVQMTIKDLIPHVRDFVGHTEWITLSGGNPCIWEELGHLVFALGIDPAGPQKKFALETQGTIWQNWVPWCTKVTVSPKGPGMGEKFEPEKFDRFVQELRGNRKPWHPGFSVKVPVFDQRDLEFVVSLLQTWPQLAPVMFLSIGNIFPPAPAKRGADGEIQADISYEEFVQQVLKSYRTILEDVMQDPRLSSVRVLPQLHTLLWGNAKGR
jgi:7-carboxy-7-deazaguanine synthase